MKIFLSALALICAALGPEAWSIIPSFRAAVLHSIAWVGIFGPFIFALVIAAILLNLIGKYRRSGK